MYILYEPLMQLLINFLASTAVFSKLLLKLEHGWVLTFDCKVWVQLRIHALNSMSVLLIHFDKRGQRWLCMFLWFNIKTSVGIPIIEVRRSSDRLIFMIEIPILVRRHRYTESDQWLPARTLYFDAEIEFEINHNMLLINYQVSVFLATIDKHGCI